jgi:hypothetical protein
MGYRIFRLPGLLQVGLIPLGTEDSTERCRRAEISGDCGETAPANSIATKTIAPRMFFLRRLLGIARQAFIF